jgi:hypothetical protein
MKKVEQILNRAFDRASIAVQEDLNPFIMGYRLDRGHNSMTFLQLTSKHLSRGKIFRLVNAKRADTFHGVNVGIFLNLTSFA